MRSFAGLLATPVVGVGRFGLPRSAFLVLGTVADECEVFVPHCWPPVLGRPARDPRQTELDRPTRPALATDRMSAPAVSQGSSTLTLEPRRLTLRPGCWELRSDRNGCSRIAHGTAPHEPKPADMAGTIERRNPSSAGTSRNGPGPPVAAAATGTCPSVVQRAR
jgi:hypothetical protein